MSSSAGRSDRDEDSGAQGRNITRFIERIFFSPDERVTKDELEAMWDEAEPVAVVSEWRHSSLCATTATGHLARCTCGADPRE